MTTPLRTYIVLAGLLWSALLFAFAPVANAGQILGAPTYIGLGSGLVGYWSLNAGDIAVDNTGGMRAYDRSGNGNHSNRSTAADAPARIIGKLGQAASFVGDSSQNISAPPSATLNTLASLSASFWMYTRNTLDFRPILTKWDTNTQVTGWGIDDCGCGTDDIGFSVGYATNPLWVTTSNAPIKRNTWQHVVVTWGGATDGTDVKIYFDGVSVAFDINSTGSGGRTSDAGEELHLGNDESVAAACECALDEVRVYNRALSTDEVKRLYKIGSTLKYGAPNSAGSLSSGLVAHWTMDGGDTSQNISGLINVFDRSGNSNKATSPSAAAAPVASPGKIGQGLVFDGSNDNLNVGDRLDPTNNIIAVSAWVKPNAVAAGQQIVSKLDATLFDTNYALMTDWVTDNRFMFIICDGNGDCDICSTTGTAGTYATSSWYHVVGMWRNEVCNVYVNGVNVTNQTQTDSTGINDNSNTSLRIGIQGDDGVSDPFNGAIDDVRIYNRALSPDEIKRLYKMGATLKQGAPNSTGSLSSGLVGWWTMDGNDIAGNIAYDRSGQGNNGTLTNGPQRAIGKIGQGLNFDGANDYVSIGDPGNGSLDFGTEPFTLSVWANGSYLSQGSSENTIVSKGDSENPNDYGIRLEADNVPHFYVGDTGDATAVTAINNGWNHIVGIRRPGGALEIYLDAVLMGTGTEVDNISNASLFKIGSDDTITERIFNGTIDEVRTYNRALTADEIKRLYNMGR